MSDKHAHKVQRESLSPELRDTLLSRQDILQRQARGLTTHLAIVERLAQVGRVVQQGSSVYGLMVWRDIDFSVYTYGIDLQRAYETLLPVLLNPRVQRVRYLNDSGLFRPDDLAQERYYFGIYYIDEGGDEWKIDISFWLHGDLHQEPVHESIERELTDETRIAILWIKDTWYRLSTYRTDVYSTDIYDAVLAHHVRTPAEFDRYLGERGKPTRTTGAPP
jgi:hypothetical protein